MLTLKGPSTRASYSFVVPPEGKCCSQACSSAAGPGAVVSSWGVSRASPCPTAHLPTPDLLLTAPFAPASWASALLPACTARCSLAMDGSQIPPPARSHGLVLLLASSGGCTLTKHEPQEVQQGEAQSPAPGEGQCQAPAHAAGCPARKQPGEGDHAAALEHRLPSCSSRSSLGTGISSPLLGNDPPLADAH